MSVQVRVNEQGTLRNGRFAFSGKLALVVELLQNARRAGATQVVVTHDPSVRRLTITDDGCGISDFQTLLTLNESGWEAEAVQAERPFGVGFFKCLYAATRVRVTSRGRRLAFDCDEALAQAQLEVVAAPEADPVLTVVELDGVELPTLDLQRMERITRGYPVPVRFNGADMARRHGVASLGFTATDVGLVHLAGRDSGRPSVGTVLYLQGQALGDDERGYFGDCGGCDVIHLDPQRFAARMPDRAELIDADEQRHVIDEAVRRLWQQVLLDKKATLAPDAFVETYYEVTVRQDLLSVHDDLPLVPRQACLRVVGYPVTGGSTETFLDHCDRHPSLADVRGGVVRLMADAWADQHESCAAMTFARAASLTLVYPHRLGSGHWALEGLQPLVASKIEVAAVGTTHEQRFDGVYFSAAVRLCEAVELRYEGETVRIADEALFHDGVVFYPDGCSHGEVVRQACDYWTDEERFDEAACEDDAQGLVRLVRVLRCDGDPSKLLQCLLREVPFGRHPLLLGRSFHVSLGADAAELAIELDP